MDFWSPNFVNKSIALSSLESVQSAMCSRDSFQPAVCVISEHWTMIRITEYYMGELKLKYMFFIFKAKYYQLYFVFYKMLGSLTINTTTILNKFDNNRYYNLSSNSLTSIKRATCILIFNQQFPHWPDRKYTNENH